MRVEPDRALRELDEPRREVRPQGVGAHTVDHDEQHIEHRPARLAPQGSARVVQLTVGRPAESGQEPVLARPGFIHQAEPRHASRLVEGEVQRQITREGCHRHVIVRVCPCVDEVAGEEAASEAQGKVPPHPMPRGPGAAPPEPDRQHGLDGQTKEKVKSEKRPGVQLQHDEREDVEVVPVLGEDQGVEHQEAEDGAGQKDAERQDHPGPRDQQHHGDKQEEREGAERGELAHVGEDGIHPGPRGRQRGVVPEIPQTDDAQEGRIDDGKPATPAEQPSSGAHLHPPCRRPALSAERRIP